MEMERRGQLPPDIETADVDGSFLLKKYPGSYDVIINGTQLICCSGKDGRERANRLASALNQVFNDALQTFSDERGQENSPTETE